MTVDKLSIFDGEKKPGQRELPRVELTKELLDSVRHIEGFPIGSDEDIIRLSDPPYYTACPNPFIGEFIKKYGKPYDPETDSYHREPFTADVSEGKNDPVYNAHTYHTKVPHKAIMRYILHYTHPGDLVFDAFCGTGMTGVAAQLCGNRATVEELGYRVSEDGTVLKEMGSGEWKPFSTLGERKAILSDLSPAASFIAYNYNSTSHAQDFLRAAENLIADAEEAFGWLYLTLKPQHSGLAGQLAQALTTAKSLEESRVLFSEHRDLFCPVTSLVWSDVLICPECSKEIVFATEPTDNELATSQFSCPHCGTVLTKRSADKQIEHVHDVALGREISRVKQLPVQVHYLLGRAKKVKQPDQLDVALLSLIDKVTQNTWYPCYPMMFKGTAWGETWRSGYHTGITHVHHFYFKRTLIVLSHLHSKIDDPRLTLLFTSQLINLSKLNRFRPGVSFPYNPLSGTLYVGSQISEANVFIAYRNKKKRLQEAFKHIRGDNLVSTNSVQCCKENSIDYIFTDPPFGGNLMYSELNFLWEAWLKVFTNSKPEAIESRAQGKTSSAYHALMIKCFSEYYRALKPGRWITVEFHNSQNKIWNIIQDAMLKAGFVIANVASLDKQQGTFKQTMSTTAVKQDLVISAYKPSSELERQVSLKGEDPQTAWAFVREHLRRLPVVLDQHGRVEPVLERRSFLLYDRMIAFHIERGLSVPMGSSEFYAGLPARFVEREGMYFLPDQATVHDRIRSDNATVGQLSVFIVDERSAILWVRTQLEERRQTFGELQPQFMKNGQPGRHERMPDLQKILEQNFLQDEHGRWFVPDTQRQSDLERLRERELLREFEEYLSVKGKLKLFRSEAVRAGFRQAWAARDYATIVSLSKKLPEDVLQEDSALLMYYDNARTRLED